VYGPSLTFHLDIVLWSLICNATNNPVEMELAPGSDPSLGLVVATGDLRQEAQKDSLLYAHIRNLEVLKSLASSLLNDSNIKNSNNEAESSTNNSRSGLTWLHDSRNKAVSLHQAECKKNEELQKKLKFMEATGVKQANVIAEIRKENCSLKSSVAKLERENIDIRTELKKTEGNLVSQVTGLNDLVTNLKKKNTNCVLQAENKALKEQAITVEACRMGYESRVKRMKEEYNSLEAELQEAQGINNQLIADVASTTLPVVEALRAELEAEKKKNLEKSKRSCTLKENLKKLFAKNRMLEKRIQKLLMKKKSSVIVENTFANPTSALSDNSSENMQFRALKLEQVRLASALGKSKTRESRYLKGGRRIVYKNPLDICL
jgi:hypothetical protein